MATIQNWSVQHLPADMYTAPEQLGVCLRGEVYGHVSQQMADGDTITTSRIVAVDGSLVTTKSGTVYTLGAINPEYLEWCKKTEGVRVPCEGDWIRVH